MDNKVPLRSKENSNLKTENLLCVPLSSHSGFRYLHSQTNELMNRFWPNRQSPIFPFSSRITFVTTPNMQRCMYVDGCITLDVHSCIAADRDHAVTVDVEVHEFDDYSLDLNVCSKPIVSISEQQYRLFDCEFWFPMVWLLNSLIWFVEQQRITHTQHLIQF